MKPRAERPKFFKAQFRYDLALFESLIRFSVSLSEIFEFKVPNLWKDIFLAISTLALSVAVSSQWVFSVSSSEFKVFRGTKRSILSTIGPERRER